MLLVSDIASIISLVSKKDAKLYGVYNWKYCDSLTIDRVKK